ncbi:unnamed protein product [Cladocopium goreaui]|uniref:Uncharacterized protein n=1 Tax=Cladocopium goreaui TaxID=2562237 RepID=A0A9P1D4U7_9DINO|nr:unnamed protein product [Cladocopium goreaui]
MCCWQCHRQHWQEQRHLCQELSTAKGHTAEVADVDVTELPMVPLGVAIPVLDGGLLAELAALVATWLKGLVRPSEEAKRKKDASSTGQRENRVDEAYTACTTLLQLSCGNQASPLFRPLGGSWSIIYEGLDRRTGPTSSLVAAALHAAAEFVQGAKAPDLRLQFALLVHTDEAAMSRFVRDVEGAIVCLCKDIGPSTEPLLTEEGLLNQWRSDIEAFRRRCKEIWELYMYFVFLDVKGDWALLRMVSRQLMNLLEVSASSFAANLSLTGPWAQPAQQMLAQGMGQMLLQRRHQQALEEWHSAVQVATAKACESAALSSPGNKKSLDAVKAELHRQQALQFWTHYFQTSAGEPRELPVAGGGDHSWQS